MKKPDEPTVAARLWPQELELLSRVLHGVAGDMEVDGLYRDADRVRERARHVSLMATVLGWGREGDRCPRS